MSTVKNQSAHVANDAKEVAQMAKESPWVDTMTRLGYAVRGIIYGLIGYLSIRAALPGQGGRMVDQNGVLSTIAASPYGKYMLMVIAVGFVGLLMWGIIRAILDPYQKGSDLKGLIARAGYLISSVLYGALLFFTLNLINGRHDGGANAFSTMTSGFLAQPWSKPLLILIGVIILGVGVYHVYSGLNVKFNTRFEAFKMTNQQRKIAITMGRIGMVALGVVLAVMGFLTIMTATSLRSAQIATIDQALVFLVRQPYGPVLLILVAAGLVAYAIYSIMGALWFRIRTA